MGDLEEFIVHLIRGRGRKLRRYDLEAEEALLVRVIPNPNMVLESKPATMLPVRKALLATNRVSSKCLQGWKSPLLLSWMNG